MSNAGADFLRPVDESQPGSISDQVFTMLYQAIIRLDLKPGEKLSEIAIAKQVGLSRQPVREAFQRLAAVGFLSIRPQRATVVTFISEQVLHNAQFIRCSLELASLRAAVEEAQAADIETLQENLDRQQSAMEEGRTEDFYQLDNEFHVGIAEAGGHGHMWPLISLHKAHGDRMRALKLPERVIGAYSDHLDMLDAIRARDQATAELIMRRHLNRYRGTIKKFKAGFGAYMSV